MRHRMTQVLLPHTTENPIFFHAVFPDANDDDGDDNAAFQHTIDQMAEVGFEMLIYSFGSSFQLETTNQSYMDKIKNQVDYARSKGIEVGGYDLIVLDRGHSGYGGNVGDEFSAVDLNGNLTVDVCLASGWYEELAQFVFYFVNQTGISMLETDGPYVGASCASTNHSHHVDHEDSVYQQMQLQNNFFLKLRGMGVYLNQPDTYFFQGGSRTGMGYSEQQYSLPRWKQLTISRMGLYDDLYRYLPTQGWMFVPLTEYQGGGEAATFADHPEELEWALAQYLGAGTAACYRGPFVYDEASANGRRIESILKRWIGFYKKHRDTLIQPIVHLQRPTMQTWDGWLHVHPFATREVGLVMIFNPTDHFFVGEEIVLPLYYTSLVDDVWVRVNDNDGFATDLDRDYSVTIALDMNPRSIHTIVLERMSSIDESLLQTIDTNI
jgi:hypothetical protein